MSREPIWRRYARFLRPDLRADLDEEMRFHIEERARELATQGLDRETAARRAREEFGNAAAARAECETIHATETTRVSRARAWTDLGRDVRYALRSLARRPAHAALVTITLALGLGATTAILSVVNGVLLRPLPYDDPSRLAWVHEWSPRGDDHNPVSIGNYFDWKARARSFVVMGALLPPVRRDPDGKRRARATRHGGRDAFGAVGPGRAPRHRAALHRRPMPPATRAFSSSATRSGGRASEPTRAFSPGAWCSTDSRGPSSASCPKASRIPMQASRCGGSVNESALNAAERRSHNLAVVARLRNGVTFTQAQAEMDAIATQLGVEYPQFMKDWRVNVTAMHADIVAPVRSLIVILLAGAALLLVVACGNAGNLLLTRALARSREIAVRGALGAGGFRIVRQLLVESLVLAGLATIAGVGVAVVALRALLALAPPDLPRLEEIRLDPMVLGASVLIAIVSTLLVGLAPALRLARVDLQGALRAAHSGGDRHGRLRGALVIVEVAASLVMLVGAGLLVRSFDRLRQVDLGFEPKGLLAASLSLPRSRYPDAPAQYQFYERLQERLGSFPGVTAASGSSEPPAYTHPTTFSFAIQGKVAPNPSGRFDPVPLHAVMPGYFSTLGIPLLRGRVIDARDRADAPAVAMVNQALANQLWGAEDPVGAHIAFAGPEGPWLEVIGVVGDTRMEAADQEPRPTLYTPWLQKTWRWLSWQTALVRLPAGADPAETIGEHTARAHRARPRPRDPQARDGRRAVRGRTGAAAAGGGAARWIRRHRARPRRHRPLRGHVHRGRGAAAGDRRPHGSRRWARRRACAWCCPRPGDSSSPALWSARWSPSGSTKLLSAMLYETSPVDPVTFIAVAVLLAVAGLGAALVPARRATAIDPVTAIRD